MSFANTLVFRWMCYVSAAASFLGCNAVANFDAVSSEKSKAVLRFDQFQAVAGNGRTLVGVGSYGVVVASDNGGKNWTRTVLGGRPSLIGLANCPDGSFVALDFYRKVWVGEAGARSWSPRELKTAANPLAITCDAKGRYWVVGSNSTILSSGDQGANWKETTLGQDAMLTTVQFFDGEYGVITGEFGMYLTTADGGATWAAGNKIANDFYPYAAYFQDRNTGWVSGLGGAIVHTTDGGRSWKKQPNPAGAPMFGLVRHGNDIYALGVNGLVLKFRQDEWAPVQAGRPAPYLRSAVSLNQKDLLIAGGTGMLEIVSLGATATKVQN